MMNDAISTLPQNPSNFALSAPSVQPHEQPMSRLHLPHWSVPPTPHPHSCASCCLHHVACIMLLASWCLKCPSTTTESGPVDICYYHVRDPGEDDETWWKLTYSSNTRWMLHHIAACLVCLVIQSSRIGELVRRWRFAWIIFCKTMQNVRSSQHPHHGITARLCRGLLKAYICQGRLKIHFIKWMEPRNVAMKQATVPKNHVLGTSAKFRALVRFFPPKKMGFGRFLEVPNFSHYIHDTSIYIYIIYIYNSYTCIYIYIYIILYIYILYIYIYLYTYNIHIHPNYGISWAGPQNRWSCSQDTPACKGSSWGLVADGDSSSSQRGSTKKSFSWNAKRRGAMLRQREDLQETSGNRGLGWFRMV